MKRFISVLLVLATLLCLVPVSATAATEEPQANSEESTFSYLDLYVKDGLVALFDAYSATSSNEALTSWTPVDFYGKEGYTSYLDPTSYTAALVSDATKGSMTWKYANGYLSSNFVSVREKAPAAYFNLTSLLTLMQEQGLGSEYTVQSVRRLVGSNLVSDAYQVSVDESGRYIVDNYATVSKNTYESGVETFGTLAMNWRYQHAALNDGNFRNMGTFWVQITGIGTKNVSFDNTNYFDTVVRHTYYKPGESGADPTKITSKGDAIFLNDGQPMHVLEQTVSRYSTATEADGTITYATYYKLAYQFAPYKYASNSFGTERTMAATSATEATTKSTTCTILYGKVAENYSVRVYDRVLAAADRNCNHLADLFGFYDIEVSGLAILDDEQIVAMATTYATTKMIHNRYESDGVTFTAEYNEQKAALQAAVDAAVWDAIGQVTENLLSFDRYSFRASGDYGIRTLYLLDKSLLALLEKHGCELVAYGAMTAIGEYNGTVYNTLESLVLTVAEDGKLSLPENVRGAAFVASTDKDFKTLSEDERSVSFAYTTTYSVDSTSAVLAIDMLYRGYTVLQNASGEYAILYYDLPQGDTVSSLYDLHAKVIADYGMLYKDMLGTGAAFDRIYDVLTAVDPELHNAAAREAARALAAN